MPEPQQPRSVNGSSDTPDTDEPPYYGAPKGVPGRMVGRWRARPRNRRDKPYIMPGPLQPDLVNESQVMPGDRKEDYQYQYADCDKNCRACELLHKIEKQLPQVMKSMSQIEKHTGTYTKYDATKYNIVLPTTLLKVMSGSFEFYPEINREQFNKTFLVPCNRNHFQQNLDDVWMELSSWYSKTGKHLINNPAVPKDLKDTVKYTFDFANELSHLCALVMACGEHMRVSTCLILKRKCAELSEKPKVSDHEVSSPTAPCAPTFGGSG